MDNTIYSQTYEDASVAAGLDELRKVDAEKAFATKLCQVYNNAFNSVDVCHAPCRDLIGYSDDMLIKIISVYANQLDLACSGLSFDSVTDTLTQNIAFVPRPTLFKFIRIIASQY